MSLSKRVLVLGALVALIVPMRSATAHETRVRRAVRIPDIPGFLTLKCDFHIHTVFSDGSVWPDVRPEEAWREGLDAIAITDHIEYQPHEVDLPTKHDRSFEIARPHGDLLDVIVIRGSEITRDMPPGHFNAIFLKSVEPLDTTEWRDVLAAANEQGAFVFWNHPGWESQAPDGVAKWYPEHSELVDKKLFHGIEVVNSRSYYPEAHRWCLEKDLTMLSSSDIHSPLNLDYHVHHGDQRPMTLVFAKERTAEAIREALFARRTAVYTPHRLIGREELLRPIFERSVRIAKPQVRVEAGGRAYVQVANESDVRYELVGHSPVDALRIPERLTLAANRTSLLEVRASEDATPGPTRLELPYTVENLLTEPEQGLSVELVLDVEVTGAAK